MAENILMIALSPTMEKGQILKWNKQIGDTISSGDVICEVETDKAAMDYEAAVDGVLLEILVKEGENAVVGQPIAVVGEAGEKVAPVQKTEQEQVSGTIKVSPEQSLRQSADGFLRIDSSYEGEIHEDEDDDEDEEFVFDEPEGANSGEVELQFIFHPGENPPGAQTTQKSAQPLSEEEIPVAIEQSEASKIKVSPLAKKIAEKLGIVLASIVGSGPDGRIVRRDVEEAARKKTALSAPTPVAVHTPSPVKPLAALAAASAVATPAVEKSDSTGKVIPVSGKRKLIARRLSESMFSAPHYYLSLSIEMDNILEARERLNTSREGNISLNAFILKFVAETLKRHPIVNSTWNGDTITLHDSIDIGLAVALPDGLVTPVVRDCGNKGIAAIDADLRTLIGKARNGTLQTEEYKNPTFTVSNLGNYGIEEFTAIINPPGSAILAVGAIKREIVVKDDFEEEEDDHIFHVQLMMKVTMSCDHRVIDGAAGAAFMRDLKDLMEDPVKLLM